MTETLPPAPLSMPLDRARAARPEALALVHRGVALAYARLADDVLRVAARLGVEGIGPGDIVAVHVMKPVTHWVVTLGLMRLGAVSVTLTGAAGTELAALPAIRAVVCAPGEAACFAAGPRRIEVGRGWLDGPLPAPGALPPVEVADQALGRITFTSGSTGRAKAILLDAGRLGARVSGTPRRAGIRPGTTLWCGLGADTAFGFTATLATWREGGTVMLPSGAAGEFERMRARGVDLVLASPAALAPLIRDAAASGAPRLIGPAVVAGGRLTAELRDEIAAHLCTEVRVAYGSSEAGGVTLGPARGLDLHPGRVGVVFDDVDVAVVDEAGAPVPPDTEGRLKLRSDSLADGYLGDPEATARFFRDGWFFPGDIARLSATGGLTLVGRGAQILNLGGVKLPVEDLEALVGRVDGVADVCALLVGGGPEGGEPELAIAAVATPAAAAALGTTIRAAVPLLPPFRLFTLAEIPRGSMGKVRREAIASALGAAPGDPAGDGVPGLTLLGRY